MKHSTIIFICGLFILAGVACKKRRDAPVVYPPNELHYKATACSDPWFKRQATDAELAVKVKEWLLQQGITVSEVKITGTKLGMVCDACHCVTGLKIVVQFDPKDIEKAKSFNFYKP